MNRLSKRRDFLPSSSSAPDTLEQKDIEFYLHYVVKGCIFGSDEERANNCLGGFRRNETRIITWCISQQLSKWVMAVLGLSTDGFVGKWGRWFPRQFCSIFPVFIPTIPVHDPNTELSPERKLPASLSNDELDEARVPSSGKLAHEASTVRWDFSLLEYRNLVERKRRRDNVTFLFKYFDMCNWIIFERRSCGGGERASKESNKIEFSNARNAKKAAQKPPIRK